MVQAVQESVQILFTIIAVYRSDLGLLPKWRNNRSIFEPTGSFAWLKSKFTQKSFILLLTNISLHLWGKYYE